VSIGYIETPPEFTTGTLDQAIGAAAAAVLVAPACKESSTCNVCRPRLESLLRRLCIARGAR
jgi:hypothetical protein